MIERVPKSKNLFNFLNVEKKEIFQEIVFLDASKACQDTDVLSKIIKDNANIFTDFVHPSIHTSINNGDFPSFLNLANLIPVFKKDCKNSKDNYKPISILKNIPKVYERILFKQIGTFIIFFQNFNVVLENVIVHSNVFLHEFKNGSLHLIKPSHLVHF